MDHRVHRDVQFLFEPALWVVDLPHRIVHDLGDWDTAVTVTTAEDSPHKLCSPSPGSVIRSSTSPETYSPTPNSPIVERVLTIEVQRIAQPIGALLDELPRTQRTP